jgi:hypothetical protein
MNGLLDIIFGDAFALGGPGIYRTANGRRVTWSEGTKPYFFGGEWRLLLAVENSTGEGEFSVTYRMDGSVACYHPALPNGPYEEPFRIVERAEA